MNRFEEINYSELELLSYSGGSDNHGLLNGTPATVVTSSQPCLASIVKITESIVMITSLWASYESWKDMKSKDPDKNTSCNTTPVPRPTASPRPQN